MVCGLAHFKSFVLTAFEGLLVCAFRLPGKSPYPVGHEDRAEISDAAWVIADRINTAHGPE